MEPVETHAKDMQFGADDTTGMAFSQHSAPVTPLGEEATIRTEAAGVVQSIPLPDEPQAVASTKVSSFVYGDGGAQQSDISELTAEDIREDY